jgi:hypothetical protein
VVGAIRRPIGRQARRCVMAQTHRAHGKAFGTCDRCGADFVRTARGKPYRYCSRECSIVPIDVRFAMNVDSSGECWLWLGKKNSDGYGELEINKRTVKAHRYAFQQVSGKSIPSHLEVCHTCDQPACVRPAHLFLGTHSDNMIDMTNKGRGKQPNLRGEECGASKLTESQVRSIRADTRSQRAIAADYGVRQNLVSRIKTGKIWKHVK